MENCIINTFSSKYLHFWCRSVSLFKCVSLSVHFFMRFIFKLHNTEIRVNKRKRQKKNTRQKKAVNTAIFVSPSSPKGVPCISFWGNDITIKKHSNNSSYQQKSHSPRRISCFLSDYVTLTHSLAHISININSCFLLKQSATTILAVKKLSNTPKKTYS